MKGGARVRGTLSVMIVALSACAGEEAPPGEPIGELPSALGERVRVEVLNGGGKAGMARLATDRLRGEGFDVVYFGNGPAATESEVVDRVGRPELARGVAGALGVARVRSEPDTSRYVDVTVLLGPDWGPGVDPGIDPGPPGGLERDEGGPGT